MIRFRTIEPEKPAKPAPPPASAKKAVDASATDAPATGAPASVETTADAVSPPERPSPRPKRRAAAKAGAAPLFEA